MAQRVIIELLDDMDGTTAATQTVSFGLDGIAYDIDLSDKNAEKVRKALAPFIEKARRTGKAPKSASNGSKAAKAASTGPKPADVRKWAQDNGHEVPDRGRIPQEIQDAYAAAN